MKPDKELLTHIGKRYATAIPLVFIVPKLQEGGSIELGLAVGVVYGLLWLWMANN